MTVKLVKNDNKATHIIIWLVRTVQNRPVEERAREREREREREKKKKINFISNH